MAFPAHLSMKPETNTLKVTVIKTADPIKERISLLPADKSHLQHTLLCKKASKLWFKAKRPEYRQLCLKLAI